MNKSVLACQAGAWHLAVWHPANPLTTFKRIPFRCRSWRHAGDCRQWKGAQDFVRVFEAIKARKWWTYAVLTFAQRDWASEWKQAKAGVLLWSKLRKRIVRAYGPMAYIQTWERHRKRGLHVNLAMASRPIFQEVAELQYAHKWRWLIDACTDCGFGRICWAEPLRGDDGTLAGYLTKLSRELTGADPKNQVPTQAPPHFRRIRASRGCLPPCYKSEFTGRLFQAPLECFIGRAPLSSPAPVDLRLSGTLVRRQPTRERVKHAMA